MSPASSVADTGTTHRRASANASHFNASFSVIITCEPGTRAKSSLENA